MFFVVDAVDDEDGVVLFVFLLSMKPSNKGLVKIRSVIDEMLLLLLLLLLLSMSKPKIEHDKDYGELNQNMLVNRCAIINFKQIHLYVFNVISFFKGYCINRIREFAYQENLST